MENPIKMDGLGGPLFLETPNYLLRDEPHIWRIFFLNAQVFRSKSSKKTSWKVWMLFPKHFDIHLGGQITIKENTLSRKRWVTSPSLEHSGRQVVSCPDGEINPPAVPNWGGELQTSCQNLSDSSCTFFLQRALLFDLPMKNKWLNPDLVYTQVHSFQAI